MHVKEPSVNAVEIHEFSTLSHHSTAHPEPNTLGTIPFTTPSSTPPTVLLGLTSLNQSIPCIRCTVRSVADTHAYVELASWADTEHHSSTCAALVIPQGTSEIQCGRFSTTEDHPCSEPQLKTSRRIAFARPYDAPPSVVVWLDSVDTGSSANCRVAVCASDVSRDGFTIHLDTWGDTKLWSAGASWLAYPTHTTNIRSGSFHTNDVRPDLPPQASTAGRVAYGGTALPKAPEKIFVAFNALDVDRWKYVRVQVHTGGATTTGMDWHIESWVNTILYSAGASFIVFT